MSNVEKYGLLVLFILCAVILGVGVFGDSGTSKPGGWQEKEAAAKLADSEGRSDGRSEGRSDGRKDASPDAPKTPAKPENGGRLVPEPEREQTFDDVANQPRILDRKPDASEQEPPSNGGGGGATPVVDDRIKILPHDTFTSIAVRELGSEKHVDALMKANPEVDARRLIPGRYLQRPRTAVAKPKDTSPPAQRPDAGQRYRVQPGDSLERLSRQFYGTSKYVDLLARANGMRVTDVLKAKSEILIPKAPSATDGGADKPVAGR